MFLPACRLLLPDEDGRILLLDCASGRLLRCWSQPPGYAPIGLFAAEEEGRFYLPAKTASRGALFTLDSAETRLACTLPDLPLMTAAAQCGDMMAFSSDGALFLLTLDDLALRSLGHTDRAACTALTLCGSRLYSAWETEGGGILACHTANGTRLGEWQIDAAPTALLAEEDRLWVTFTAGRTSGEGVLILDLTDLAAPRRTRITLQTPTAMKGAPLYPCSLTRTADTVYVVNESASCLTKLDARTRTITGSITLGHSVSRLLFLPDPRFALAVGNFFGDLVFLDLVNERLLSLADAPHGFLPYGVILPASEKDCS